MKKLFLSLIVILGIHGICQAGSDPYGGQYPAVWRSSFTEAATTMQLVASGTIRFHGVVIGTPAANSWLVIYNRAVVDAPASLASTHSIVSLSDPLPPQIFDVPLSSGLVAQKFGNAKANLLWDWVYSPQPGQELKGR